MINNLEQLNTQPVWSTKKTTVTCINVIQETPDVKTFQFVGNDPVLFHFRPGQFIGIQLVIDGERHNRSYTIASAPSRPHTLELTIKLDPSGHVTPWLHENIKVGSELELRGPSGRFNAFDIESQKVLLISAGSGITPMMSMARFWCDTDHTKDMKFLNWVRSTDDIIFRRDLALMDSRHPNFNLEVICTRPGLSENWLGRRGRINSTVLADMVSDLNERTVFCCGPDGFMQQVKACLSELDFNMDNYHDETFDPGGKKKKAIAAKAEKPESQTAETKASNHLSTHYQLVLKKSGQTLTLSENDNVLESIEAAGVLVDSACRAGNCGTCRVKKVSGEVVMANDLGLDEESQSEGYILTCCTQLNSDTVLDL